MVDTVRTRAAILALLPDNTSGDISPQDHRDAIVSMFGVYGVIYVADGSTAQAGINATPVLFTAFASNGVSSGITPDHTADSLTIVTDGDYLILFENSYSGGGNDTIQFHTRVDGAEKPYGTHHKMSAGGDTVSSMFFGILSLSAAEVVTIYVESDNGGGSSITSIDSSLVLLKIG